MTRVGGLAPSPCVARGSILAHGSNTGGADGPILAPPGARRTLFPPFSFNPNLARSVSRRAGGPTVPGAARRREPPGAAEPPSSRAEGLSASKRRRKSAGVPFAPEAKLEGGRRARTKARGRRRARSRPRRSGCLDLSRSRSLSRSVERGEDRPRDAFGAAVDPRAIRLLELAQLTSARPSASRGTPAASARSAVRRLSNARSPIANTRLAATSVASPVPRCSESARTHTGPGKTSAAPFELLASPGGHWIALSPGHREEATWRSA
jgi:hypothetical protein